MEKTFFVSLLLGTILWGASASMTRGDYVIDTANNTVTISGTNTTFANLKADANFVAASVSGSVITNPGMTIVLSDNAKLTTSEILANNVTGGATATLEIQGGGNYLYGYKNADNTNANCYSGFTGTVVLNGTNGVRYMGQLATNSTAYPQTVSISGNAQFWIQPVTTTTTNLIVDGTKGVYNDGTGYVRFDCSGGNIKGNIDLVAGDCLLSIRKDRSTATNTVSGVISGAGRFVFLLGANQPNTKGTLKLTNTNIYTGGTLIKEGTLELNGTGTLGTGDILIQNDNTLYSYKDTTKTPEVIYQFTRDAGGLTFNRDASSPEYEINSKISTQTIGNGTGETFLPKISMQNGNVKLTGDLSGFQGALEQTGGTLTFGGSAASVGTGVNYTMSGGTLNLGTLAGLNAFTFSGGTVNAGSVSTVAGTIDLNGGTMNYSTLAGAFQTSTKNLNVGSTVNVATVAEWDAALTDLNWNGGVIAYTGSEYIITQNTTYPATATFDTSAYLNVPTTKTATLTVTNAGDTVTFLQGLGEQAAATGQSLVKDGAGTMVLSNATYTGKTTVNAGVLQINNNAPSTSMLDIKPDAKVVIQANTYANLKYT